MSAYQKARQPRIVVFWNKRLTDEVESAFRDRTRTTEEGSSKDSVYEEETTGMDGTSRLREADGKSRRTVETVAGTELVRSDRASLLDEPIGWELEQAFTTSLTSAGVRLVDRTTMMRMTALEQGADERPNIQALETKSIVGKADLLVEVLQAVDSRARDGISFRVTVRDVRNSRLLCSFTTEGRPAAVKMPYIATAHGFERAPQAEVGPTDVGRQIALETMTALATALR